MREKFPGVFTDGKFYYTKNLILGQRVYGEKLFSENGIEYRMWDAFRSKLCAGLKNGLSQMPISKGSKVLYLGAAEGTTISHISDIIEKEGLVVGVDLSAVSMRRFVLLCEKRANIIPILADASLVEQYPEQVRKIQFDVLFQDISQKNQAEIFLKNTQFLKHRGFGLLSVKAKSISSSERPEIVFAREAGKLSDNGFEILQNITLAPFETDHALILCRKKA